MPTFPSHTGLTAADLLDRYLAGELTSEERTAFERRLRREPALRAALDRLRMPLGEGQTPWDVTSSLDVEGAWLRQRRKITAQAVDMAWRAGGTVRGRIPRGVLLSRRVVNWRMGAAAVGACLVALAAIGYARIGGTGAATPNAYSSYATRNGQQATVTLPDGNEVVMNAASQLEVPADYAGGNHQVRLVGEALFTVTHRSRVPLTVVTGKSVIRVLGTRFVVRRYSEDPAVTVAVHEGKVAMRSVVLTAGQQAEVEADGSVRVRPATAAQFAFASGTLVLDDVPMQAAVTELNRWYDADIRLGDAVLERARVRGEFAAGSIADVQSILAAAFDVRVVRAGRVLTLYPRSEYAP